MIHGKGIEPDVVIELTETDEEEIIKNRLNHIDHPEEPNTVYIDSQLRSAIDVIKGISVYILKDKQEVQEEVKPAA